MWLVKVLKKNNKMWSVFFKQYKTQNILDLSPVFAKSEVHIVVGSW